MRWHRQMCLCESVSLKMSTITQISADSISGLLKPEQLTLYVEAEVYCLLMNKPLYLERKKKMSAHFFCSINEQPAYMLWLVVFVSIFSSLVYSAYYLPPWSLSYFHRNLWLVSRVRENTSVCLHLCAWDAAGGSGMTSSHHLGSGLPYASCAFMLCKCSIFSFRI